MKKGALLIGAILILFTACGGNTTNNQGGGDPAPDITAENLNSNAACFAAVMNQGFSEATSDFSPVMVPRDNYMHTSAFGQVVACNYLDSNDQVIPSMVNAYTYVCEYMCNGTGTFVTRLTSNGSTIFPNILNLMELETTYTGCEIENTCVGSPTYGDEYTVDGIYSVTATDMGSNPCDARVDIVSNGLTIDGQQPQVTFNIGMDISSNSDCGDAPEPTCDNNLDADSTMFDGTYTYDKEAICDLDDLCG